MLSWGTTEDSTIWFNHDREGISNTVFTELLFLFGFSLSDVIVFPSVVTNNGTLRTIQVSMFVLYLLCVYTHYLCIFTNPGSVPYNAYPLYDGSVEEGEMLMRCGICNAFKPRKCHHCSVCNRCILKMDHHCPWINNCVGMMNQKYFLLFLLYSFIFSLSVFSSSMISFFHVIYYPYGLKKILFVVMILIGAAFSLFFCVFGIAILVDTMRTVVSGSTKIDRRKGMESSDYSIQASLKEVFGGDGSFSLAWLIPSKPVFQNFEFLAGYTIDASGLRWNGYDNCIVCVINKILSNIRKRILLYRHYLVRKRIHNRHNAHWTIRSHNTHIWQIGRG